MLNGEVLEALFRHYAGDDEGQAFIEECILSFETYHNAVFREQLFRRVYGGATDPDHFRDELTERDRNRTVHHNAVIANVAILNRLAGQAGLDPVYDGVVSEERPYRRQVADAVFAWVEAVINERN